MFWRCSESSCISIYTPVPPLLQIGDGAIGGSDQVIGTLNFGAKPDMLYVSHAKKGVFTEGEVRGAPDLVVEILSPSTGSLDKGYKKVLYARYQISEYWLVDPQSQTIEVFALTEQGYRTAGLSSV